MERINWNEYFYAVAELVKSRSTCLRRQVGAVAVKNNRILATGYNGAPSKIEHCEKRGCLREKLNIPSGERSEICFAIHAEQNVILQAALHGISLADSSLYITTQPCFTCAKMLLNCQFRYIFYKEPYPDQMTINLFEAAMGIRYEKDDFTCWEFNYF